MIGPPAAIDATAYVDDACASAVTFTVGDAALALDPLSSSGVQKAIQGALSAAIVTNTLLRRPEHAEAALQFRRAGLEEASQRHRHWAASHYSKVAERVAARSGRAAPLARSWNHRHPQRLLPKPSAIAPLPRPSSRCRRCSSSSTSPASMATLLS